MKNQFIIKSARALKTLSKPIAKSESTNALKFRFAADGKCCEEFMLTTGLSQPVVSF